MRATLDSLTDDVELAIVAWGQSNLRPWGNRDTEGYVAEPGLALTAPGIDLTVTGNVSFPPTSITVLETLTVQQWVDAELRVVYQVMGNAATAARVGIARVTANTANQLSLAWSQTPEAWPSLAAVVCTFDGGTDLVTRTSHGLKVNDRVVFSGGTPPAEIVFGTTYFVQSTPDADTFTLAAALGGAAIDFTGNGTGTTSFACLLGCYLHFADKWKSYSNVRVLTPYQPEEPGAYPSTTPKVPGYSFPASVTSFEDAGLFLDFGWGEGVEGVGFASSPTGVVGLVVTTNVAMAASFYKGATLILKRVETGDMWVGTVAANDGTTATVASWLPNTTPPVVTGGVSYTCEVHLPHWRSNPNHQLHGFRYPQNDMQVCGFPYLTGTPYTGPGQTYNRPRGYLTPEFTPLTNGLPTHKFGMLLPFAWRLATMLGKRINVIHLGINGATLAPTNIPNTAGYRGTVGWWNTSRAADFSPSSPTGFTSRLKRMISVLAPGAMTAEGNTKKLRVLLILGMQGEGDAVITSARGMYRKSLEGFYSYLRSVITAAGLSPYAGGAQIPVIHAPIANYPWEWNLGPAWNGDTEKVVNAAITGFTTEDGFATSFEIPTLAETGATKIVDGMHWNGIGETRNAKSAAIAAESLIEFAFSFGLGSDAIAVANEALSMIGESASVTSLVPPNATEQARRCAQFLPKAAEWLLQAHPWTFATKRIAAIATTNTVSTWLYAYLLPANLLHPTAVLDPESADDVQIRPTSTWNDEIGIPVFATEPASAPFRIEVENGRRVLRTNQANAVLIYTAKNIPFSLWDPMAREACVARLAYHLCGAIVKGKEGAAAVQKMLELTMGLVRQAAAQNVEYQQDVRPTKPCPWLP